MPVNQGFFEIINHFQRIVMLIAKSTKQLSERIFRIQRAASLPDNRNRRRPIQVKFFVDEKDFA